MAKTRTAKLQRVVKHSTVEFIATQLHRAVGESCVFMNYAVWESMAHFKAAFSHPDFIAALSAYPSSAVASPNLFEKVAVANLCTK